MGDNLAIAEANDIDTDTAPAGLVVIQPVEGGYMVNGVLATEATHVFRDGKPVLKKDGTPKQKPGRKAGVSPFKKSAAIIVHEVPVVLGEKLDPAEQSNTSATMHPHPVALVPVAPATTAMAASMRGSDPMPEKKVEQRPLTVSVQRTFGKIAAAEADEQTLEVKTFAVEPAAVELGYGLTLNIGNYESARVDVRVSVPCYREEVNEAYEWAKKWAEERVREEVTNVRKMAIPQKSNPF